MLLIIIIIIIFIVVENKFWITNALKEYSWMFKPYLVFTLTNWQWFTQNYVHVNKRVLLYRWVLNYYSLLLLYCTYTVCIHSVYTHNIHIAFWHIGLHASNNTHEHPFVYIFNIYAHNTHKRIWSCWCSHKYTHAYNQYDPFLLCDAQCILFIAWITP